MGAWIIRAGRGGAYALDWLERGIVGIGWDFGGADISKMSREQIREAYAASHPDDSTNRTAAAVGQIYRFACVISAGDTVVMYDPSTRLYHLGRIVGDCQVGDAAEGLAYFRKVNWGKTALRDDLAASSKNSLGGIQTIFTVKDQVIADLQAAAGEQPAPAPIAGSETAAEADDDAADVAISYESADDGIEAIKDRISGFSWEEMEDLVAGLLRAMGYHAKPTGPGSDGGRDVIASIDPLGLEHPCIVAEVKHRKDTMGAPDVRSFIAGLHGNERGLYVSTGGFTKDARMETMRSEKSLRLVDLDEFVRLYIENYATTDEATRAILPLGCIWYPA